jgi:hypothetical protein
MIFFYKICSSLYLINRKESAAGAAIRIFDSCSRKQFIFGSGSATLLSAFRPVEHSKKRAFEQLIIGYSEHLHFSPQQYIKKLPKFTRKQTLL